ncbi:uncharacterized protein LOC112465798 [Temnothorax curvispinosus]|uniref:Uncharacterized protein LOC112465798 n=1 Tax=Temnothorax curvispinosus TaxID=300111 RepID=A0A6J1R8P1_9HYME|nr:uncharacterized protein LOC112465798 [Temnothorax curvispinosus]
MATKINEQDRVMTRQDSQASDKDCSSGTKVKRKSRSARRRLNAMMSNASFHFSDTDSEGELTMITNKIGKLNPAQASQDNPLISVTDAEVTAESKAKVNDNLDYLIADGEAKSRSRRGSYAENLTDVDEIYDEMDEKDTSSNLNVIDNGYQGETDMEDMEGDDDIQPTIYVTPRSDILTEFGGEMITTKEGDGPFSVEVRNRLSQEEVSIDKADTVTENVPDMPNTDSEDMEGSDDETKLDEAAAYNHVYEELDILAGSQIVMSNKIENTLHVPDHADDAISDCHTDIEDVD